MKIIKKTPFLNLFPPLMLFGLPKRVAALIKGVTKNSCAIVDAASYVVSDVGSDIISYVLSDVLSDVVSGVLF